MRTMIENMVFERIRSAIAVQQMFPERIICGSTALYMTGHLPIRKSVPVPAWHPTDKWTNNLVGIGKPMVMEDYSIRCPHDLDMCTVSTPEYEILCRLNGNRNYCRFNDLGPFKCTTLNFPKRHDLFILAPGSPLLRTVKIHNIVLQDPRAIMEVKNIWDRPKDIMHRQTYEKQLLPDPMSMDMIHEIVYGRPDPLADGEPF